MRGKRHGERIQPTQIMKFLNKITWTGLSLLAGVSMAHAAPTFTLFASPYSYPGGFPTGGEYTAVPSPANSLSTAAYSPLALVGSGFETFCVQDAVTAAFGTPYTYSETLTETVGGNPTALSIGDAWLYSQFAEGTLAGYDYTGPNRQLDAGYLQVALLYLEAGQTDALFAGLGPVSANPFINAAQTAFSGNATAPSGGAYNVVFLAPVDPNGAPAQDQLYLTVPDASTATLLSVGLGSLAAFSARFRRKSA